MLAALGLIVFAIFLVVYGGLVLSYLWEWFVVPLFNVQSLTIAQAVGLRMVGGFFTLGLAQREGIEKLDPALQGIAWVGITTFFWLIAYIVRLFL